MANRYRYKVIDLESGQCIEGTIISLSKIIGISESLFRYYAEAGTAYKKKYRLEKILDEEKKGLKNKELSKQWDEICKIYFEVVAGERRIRKAVDGKWYAVKT